MEFSLCTLLPAERYRWVDPQRPPGGDRCGWQRDEHREPCWWRIRESRGYGCLIESAAVLLPPVRGEAQSRLCFTGLWQPSFQARVCAMPIEIALKSAEFFLQVGRRPE